MAAATTGAQATSPHLHQSRKHVQPYGEALLVKLTPEMRRIIEEQKIGYVATVAPDGTPNLSPKGTCLLLDDSRIMFGEIRSPNTVKNIAERPTVEVNFVDIFSRKGVRCKGPARFIRHDDDEFDKLLPPFRIEWGDDLCSLFHGIVVIDIESASNMVSPAYDIGSKESDLRQRWLKYFSNLQPESNKTARNADENTI